MPVLEVKGLPQADGVDVGKALKATCVAIAREYGCALDQVWATWHGIAPGHYVEGETEAPETQGSDRFPPIATLTCFEGKSAAEIESILLAAARTLSAELGVPGNIFITYVEAKSGCVVAGDGVLRRG